ncbi:TetR/AcrR family transcriptional regulator [Microbacterium album]|uniref:TetR family transcriptional regulator n=1 Tax=Microbacterium album TaxID=2053191 RepID=A0A917MNF3_9MICO|nr:TetR/AcrR family transcriptional regulator [Microbacterium album]GGH51590.1 TetR family transcriptional regulator [Microbacterium album]
MSATGSEIRQPRQKRSQEAFARVLKAGREILQEEGFSGFTVQAVSKRAGVSVGSIYLRAPSREALLLAIHAQETERMDKEEVWLAPTVVPPGEARAHIESVVTRTAQQMLANSGILRAFMRRGPEDPEVFERGRAGSQRVAERFEAALLACRDDFRHPDPETAADFAFRMLYSMTSRRITHGSDFESTRPLSDDAFLAELARAVAAYLLEPS